MIRVIFNDTDDVSGIRPLHDCYNKDDLERAANSLFSKDVELYIKRHCAVTYCDNKKSVILLEIMGDVLLLADSIELRTTHENIMLVYDGVSYVLSDVMTYSHSTYITYDELEKYAMYKQTQKYVLSTKPTDFAKDIDKKIAGNGYKPADILDIARLETENIVFPSKEDRAEFNRFLAIYLYQIYTMRECPYNIMTYAEIEINFCNKYIELFGEVE